MSYFLLALASPVSHAYCASIQVRIASGFNLKTATHQDCPRHSRGLPTGRGTPTVESCGSISTRRCAVRQSRQTELRFPLVRLRFQSIPNNKHHEIEHSHESHQPQPSPLEQQRGVVHPLCRSPDSPYQGADPAFAKNHLRRTGSPEARCGFGERHLSDWRCGMSDSFIFSSESVTEGHPDKVCDTIADSILGV